MFYLYWYSHIVYFVCDSASEFGAMGSTSFLGFSYPNLLLVFSEPVIFTGGLSVTTFDVVTIYRGSQQTR